VTDLLHDWSAGDATALDHLMPLVYQELHRAAEQYLRKERDNHTLQPTALVNEAFMRLVDQNRVTWQNRSHFVAVSAQLMRRILVDHGRRRTADKRGSGSATIAIEEGMDWPETHDLDLVALDEALTALAAVDPQQSKVVELRFFGGLSVDETAEALGISASTVKREWRMARAWLLRQLER
jgi:RNA polymerase sigma factor (TIGR02999 family)